MGYTVLQCNTCVDCTILQCNTCVGYTVLQCNTCVDCTVLQCSTCVGYAVLQCNTCVGYTTVLHNVKRVYYMCFMHVLSCMNYMCNTPINTTAILYKYLSHMCYTWGTISNYRTEDSVTLSIECTGSPGLVIFSIVKA